MKSEDESLKNLSCEFIFQSIAFTFKLIIVEHFLRYSTLLLAISVRYSRFVHD